jgi:hypothetical protein
LRAWSDESGSARAGYHQGQIIRLVTGAEFLHRLLDASSELSGRKIPIRPDGLDEAVLPKFTGTTVFGLGNTIRVYD